MKLKEKVEEVIAKELEGTNYDVLTEMKAIMNSVYGDERNQITKPTYESIMSMARANGIESGLNRRLEKENPEAIVPFLQASMHNCLSYQITIHFPEITITNGRKSHLIRNIYVRLYLRPNGTLASYMEGMRTTVTEAEFLSKYLHSHLQHLDSSNIGFHRFCTGVGEINLVLTLLNAKFTSANFMVLMMHIKNFLEWESKEGHPYMYMESVFHRSNNLHTYNSLSDLLAINAGTVMLRFIRSQLNCEQVMRMFNFTVTERNIIANPTVELEKWMAQIMEGWDIIGTFGADYDPRIFFSLKDAEGKYHALPDTMRRINYQQGPILNFKGKDIEFEVIERSQTQTNETFANPKITKETCKKLSRDLTKTALTNAGIKSGSALVHISGTTGEDKVSM